MKVSQPCEGYPECRRSVSKTESKAGWNVVVIYPLDDDEDEGTRRNICRACTRRLMAVLHGG